MPGQLIPAEQGQRVTVSITQEALLAIDYSVSPDPAWGERDAEFESELLRQLNAHRAEIGARTLDILQRADDCAGWKSLHMAGHAYMTHDDPTPPIKRSCAARFADFQVSGAWGENIAMGYSSPEAVMSAWLASPGHRTNIENPSYRSVGLGCARKTSSYYWTQCFCSQAPDPAQPPTSAEHALRFADRHAIGISWDKGVFSTSQLQLYVLSGTQWNWVRDIPNSGSTYVTYPLSFAGPGSVRVSDGQTSLEGAFDVLPLTYA